MLEQLMPVDGLNFVKSGDHMPKFLERFLSMPGRLMQSINQQDIEQSNDSKIITDANGNAWLNMSNPQVRDSMQARMKELAAKR
jgi:hypothetical protein